ncbi:MAG: hypothetical protein HQK53_08135 [Oligoflexia bacterium]|nr:hypothetical protein [Oligoflexia bacterium]
MTGQSSPHSIAVKDEYILSGGNGHSIKIYQQYAPKSAKIGGRALNFADSAVIVPSFKNFPTTAITFEAWVRFDYLHSGDYATIFSYAVPGSLDEFKVARDSDGTYQIQVGKNTTEYTTLSAGFNDGRYHHLAVTLNTATGALKVYKDGVETASDTQADTSAFTADGTGTVVIGQKQGSVGGTFDSTKSFRGEIDEVRVWNVVRTANQIKEFMYAPISQADSTLVLYYDFEEDQGQTVYDKSSSANNGTFGTNSTSADNLDPTRVPSGAGLRDYALFYNSGQYAKVPGTVDIDTTFTFEAWIKPWSLADGSGEIFNFADSSGAKTIYGGYDSSGHITFKTRSASSGGYDFTLATTTDVLVANEWTHVAFTISGGSAATIYYNGFSSATGTITVNPITAGDSRDTYLLGNGSLLSMKNVRVWNVTRTAAEIAANATRPSLGSETGLLAYYPMNEGNGQTIYDLSTNANNATLGATSGTDAASDPSWQMISDFNIPTQKGIKFDGTDDFTQTLNSNVNLANSNMTIALWANAVPTGTGQRTFIAQGTGTADTGLSFLFNNATQMNFSFWSDDAIYTTLQNYDPGWHYWVATYDSATKTQKIYRDGVEIKSRTANADYQGSGILYLGKYFNGNYRLNGSLDEVRIYNRTLSATEVKSTMNRQLRSSEYSGLLVYYDFNEQKGQYVTDLSGNRNHSVRGTNGASESSDPQWFDDNRSNAKMQTVIYNPPSATTTASSISLTILGRESSITHYKYKVDSGSWSAAQTIATALSASSLINGSHTVYIIGCTSSTNCAPLNTSSATTYTWTVSNPPTVTKNVNNRVFPLDGVDEPLVQGTPISVSITSTEANSASPISALTCTYETVGLHTSDPNYAAAGASCTTLPSLATI